MCAFFIGDKMDYFEIAYKEALKAKNKKEIPVGAVIVKNNKIIAKACNSRQYKYNVLGHAEINCILKAERKLKDWRLDDCELYVTLEPCEMCNMIINEARINNVFYILDKSHKIQTNVCSVVGEKYKSLLKNFFDNLRK